VVTQEIFRVDRVAASIDLVVHVSVLPYLAFSAKPVNPVVSVQVFSGQFAGCGYFDLFSGCAVKMTRMNCLPGSLRPPGW